MKKILIATLGAGLLLGSCTKDFEEINKNPNVPEDYLTYWILMVPVLFIIKHIKELWIIRLL